jgi:hypothetical protein
MFLHAEHYYPFKRIAMKQEYTCYTSWTLAFVVDRKGEREEIVVEEITIWRRS